MPDKIDVTSLSMYHSKKQEYSLIHDLMSKGFYEVLLLVKDNGGVRYGQISKYVTENDIASGPTVNRALNNLSEMGLVRRRTLKSKPAGTAYEITKKGSDAVEKIENLARSLSSSVIK